IGWAVHAAVLAWIARRTGDNRAEFGVAAFVALALGHLLAFEAPPDALGRAVDNLPDAVVGIVAVAAACVAAVYFRTGERFQAPQLFEGLAAALVIYGCSVAIVSAFGGGQSGQLVLSAFWAVTGLGALVTGLARDVQR